MVASRATWLNTEEWKLLLGLINEFEELFDVTLVKWDTQPVDLELVPVSRIFIGRYYPVPRTNKDTFNK